MGASHSKEPFTTAISDLVSNQQSVGSLDDSFWDRYWSSPNLTTDDVFSTITRAHVNELMTKASGNLTALCFKLVSRINTAVSTACSGPNEHIIVINCVRLLTRLIPFLFESDDWRQLFWTPAHMSESSDPPPALAQALLDSLMALLFCPDFTVVPKVHEGPEEPDVLSSLDGSEYIWESGIGCSDAPIAGTILQKNRIAIIKLITTCFSENLYIPASTAPSSLRNQWLKHFTSANNRHALPLLASLLNVICNYDPIGYGIPYYYAMVNDVREELVEASCNLLAIIFNFSPPLSIGTLPQEEDVPATVQVQRETGLANLFLAYMARLHQSDDLEFLVKGLVRLASNPLRQSQTYLPSSIKRIYFNEKFQSHLLRGSSLFDLLLPLLKEILDIRNNPNMVGLLHVGVFILLMLSGERNFGVRLNKPYTAKVKLDIPNFVGTHGDLMFLVIHKVITSGLSRIQPMYDCLLTVLVNVSPYLKSLSMVTCTRLMHLMESFSTPWYLFAKPNSHYLVFYLLEILNNIVQYQFDGNIHLVYTIVRSKEVFYQLAALSEDSCLSMFPRQRPIEKASTPHSEDTDHEEGLVTLQRVPEIQPIENVTMVEVEAVHEDTHTPNEDPVEDAITPPPESKGADIPDQQQTHTTCITNGSNSSIGDGEKGASDVGNQEDIQVMEEPQDVSDTTPKETRQTIPTESIISAIEPLPTFSSSYDIPLKSLAAKPKESNLPPRQLMPLVNQSASGNRKLLEPLVKSDFRPTPEWVHSWKQRLPLHTVLRLLQILVPQVEKLCNENDVSSEKEILEYLKNGTLVGLLPVPHPIIIRKYQSSETTDHWFHSYIWGVIYSRSFDPPIWYDTDIKLFIVNKTFE